ncbi:MAG: hypothetical protein NTU61_04905 [Candidatus Altiarchaeota archaeon]|nr:hypothetical protein [Candidatus Altiarchaeota archaeon]
MNSGKIVSKVGDQIVVELAGVGIPGLGKRAFCNGKNVGVVFDIIGRVEKPHVVVRTRNLEANLIGKLIQFK